MFIIDLMLFDQEGLNVCKHRLSDVQNPLQLLRAGSLGLQQLQLWPEVVR